MLQSYANRIFRIYQYLVSKKQFKEQYRKTINGITADKKKKE